MYAKSVIESRLKKASQSLGFEIQYHSEADRLRNVADLVALRDEETGNLKGKLDADQIKFIRNERARITCDLSAYHQYCNPPEAPIWMADLTFKPIGEIRPGDFVVGWDRPTGRANDFMRKSEVVAVARRRSHLIKLTMASGRVLRCTPDHLWANGKSTGKWIDVRGQKPRKFVTAEVGGVLRFFMEPYSPESLSVDDIRLAAWLGGIFDGEGTCSKHGGRISLAQSTTANPVVYAEIGRVLRHFGFPYSEANNNYFVRGGVVERLKFLLYTKPVKEARLRASILGGIKTQPDRIVSREDDGEGEVISLQTETGNYVAWGYGSKNCTIIGWDGRKTKYRPNIAQRIMGDLRAEMEEKGHSIEILNLKARRLGVSTDEELAIAQRVQCWSHTTAIVASADPEMSAKMSQIMELNWDNMPWFLMPRKTRYNVGELIGFGDMGSQVSIQAGSQLKGIGRGDTPNVAHLSEISYYKNPEELIEASLFRAIIPNPYVLLMLETTAAGRFGWTYDTWLQAKENWPNSRLRPVFLPWYVGRDIYPSETWIKQFPIPVGWHPHELTIKHAEQAAAYVRVNDILRKYLGPDWKMPLEQMWWWEFNYREAKQKKTLAKFLAEIAADDESAFQSGNTSCFDVEVISAHRTNTRPPLDVYGFNGVHIAPRLRVDPERSKLRNHNKPCIDITARWHRMQEPMSFQLVPVLWTPAQSHLNHLLIYEHPKPDQTYGFGVDTSEGVGRDRSVIQGIRKGTMYDDAEQVALYSSSTIGALDLWSLLMALGTYFSTKDQNYILRQARIAIEVGRGSGEACQEELKKSGWTNFHPWHRMAAPQKFQSQSQSIGWRMTEASRRFMLLWLIDAIDNYWIRVNAPSTVSELEALEKDHTSQKLKASYGAFDDEVMALGIGLASLHLEEILLKKSMDRRKNATVAREYLRYKPPLSASSLPDHMMNNVRTTVDDSYEMGQSLIDRLSGIGRH